MKAPLEWKLLRRELRADRGLFAFAAVAVAVAACALALVLSLAAAFDSALASDARVLLGGDFRVSLRERDFSEAEQEWLRDNAGAVSFARETQAMALADGRAQLTRLKSVDENYPLVGEIALGGGARFDPRDLGEENGVFNAMVEPSLGDILGLAIGDSFRAAGLTLRVAAFIESEPDPADTRPILSAPLVLISQRAIERGRILVPGAIVRRDAKTLAPDAGAAFADKLRARFADGGFRVSTPEQALSRMRRQIDRVRVFFNLAALAAAIVAGVGVGGAVGIFLRRRQKNIAILKMVGAKSARVARLYLAEVMLFAGGGALAGSFAGCAIAAFVLPLAFAGLPFSPAAFWSGESFLRAVAVSILIAAAFSILPTRRYAALNPLVLFKESAGGDFDAARGRKTALFEWLFFAVPLALAFWISPLAAAQAHYLLFVALAAAVFYGAAIAISHLAAKAAPKRWIAARLGLRLLARGRRHLAAGAVSLGLCLTALVAAREVETNFAAALDDAIKTRAPSFFLIGAQPPQLAELRGLVAAHGGRIDATPLARARIMALGGTKVEDMNPPEDVAWIIRRDRGITWTDSPQKIGGSRVIAGDFWDETRDDLQVSFDAEAAAKFGLEIGDEVELRILGEPATARIANLRDIDWRSLNVNFVMIFSRPPLPDLPFGYFAGVFAPDEATPVLQREIAERFPNITPVAVAGIIDRIKGLLSRAAQLARLMGLFLLAGGAIVAALAVIEHRQRRFAEILALRIVGAGERRVARIAAVEFAALGLMSALPALVFGALAGGAIVSGVFDLEWEWQWPQAILLVAGAAAIGWISGLLSLRQVLRNPILPHLRNE